jgi:hypothetical protein
MNQQERPRPRISEAGRARALDAARAMANELDLVTSVAPHAAHRWSHSVGSLPTLHLDDVSAIPFLADIDGVEEYQHRGRLRARDGDFFATVTPSAPGYEDYCRDRLGLGSPIDLKADGVDAPLAVAAACGRGEAFTRLTERAGAAGAYAIHPYMGIESVWELAASLARAASVPVSVLAPPPSVTWIANDKMLLSALVAASVGEEAIVETQVTHTVDGLAAALIALSGRHEKVAFKRLRTASAMGNAVYESAALRALSPEQVGELIGAELARMEWGGDEPVLAVAWEETDCSPSTQWWVPPEGAGDPQLDGIYEQILAGEEKVFVGSRPSRLSPTIERGLVDQSFPVVIALQALGYTGRCSFDHLVHGDIVSDKDECTLRITECNGRWGGTSTPMSLLDRLIDGPRPPYRAQDIQDDQLVGVTFPELLTRLDDLLFDPTRGTGHLILYNVGPLERHGKLDVISIGDTQEDAERRLVDELPRRLLG